MAFIHLQESGAKAGQPGEGGTLSSLSTYLLLQKAEEQYGWSPEKEGISNDEAGTIARLFAQYDTNSDDKWALPGLHVVTISPTMLRWDRLQWQVLR